MKFIYSGYEYDMALEDFEWIGDEYIAYQTFNMFDVFFFCGKDVNNVCYFNFLPTKDFKMYQSRGNQKTLIIPLESEIALSHSNYLDYMRNGYNFDVKLKDISGEKRELGYLSQNWATGRSMVTTNPISILKAGVKMGEDMYIQGQEERLARMQEDLEMEKNISQLKASKVDISQVSAGNDKMNFTQFVDKMICSIMLPRRDYWKKIDDYFYLYGNKVEEYKKPLHNNRVLFDYLKCKAEFINRNAVATEEVLSDIINRLSLGVTFIHKKNNNWIFDYENKENVEVRLLEELSNIGGKNGRKVKAVS